MQRNRLRHLITTDTGIASQNKASASTNAVEVLLGQISILDRIAHNNQGIALVDELDRTLVGSNNRQHVVIEHEFGSAELVTLGQSDAVSSVELAIDLLFDLLGRYSQPTFRSFIFQ